MSFKEDDPATQDDAETATAGIVVVIILAPALVWAAKFWGFLFKAAWNWTP